MSENRWQIEYERVNDTLRRHSTLSDQLCNGELSGDELSGDELSGDDLSGDELSDDELSDS